MDPNISGSAGGLIDPGEIAAFAARYGEPVRWTRVLDVGTQLLEKRTMALQKRRGEIVLAIPRPNGRVLLHTKDFYPANAYRLLSGGIELGEGVEDAARREILEETGFSIQPVRFLGLVEYEFRNAGAHAPWVSYVVLTEETGEPPRVTDTGERISDFREVEWTDLPGVAENLEHLNSEWQDWGRFRAIPHRLVAEIKK